MCCFLKTISTVYFKELICQNLDAAGLYFVVCFERGGRGPGVALRWHRGDPDPPEEGGRQSPPTFPQSSVQGGCVCRKEVNPWLAVFGQGKSSLLLPRPEQLLGQLGEHQGCSGLCGKGTRMQHCLQLPLTSTPPRAWGNHKGRKRSCSPAFSSGNLKWQFLGQSWSLYYCFIVVIFYW